MKALEAREKRDSTTHSPGGPHRTADSRSSCEGADHARQTRRLLRTAPHLCGARLTLTQQQLTFTCCSDWSERREGSTDPVLEPEAHLHTAGSDPVPAPLYSM